MSIEDKLKQFHDNYLSAKESVSTAESSATKKAQFVPYFRRLFSTHAFHKFKDIRTSQQSFMETQYCQKQCEDKRQCYEQCVNFYKTALADGHQFIRKVHKDYKNATLEGEDE